MADDDPAQPRTRRAPPPFRRATVRHADDLTPRMRRLVLGGPELAGFEIPGPASSVRLLLPPPGSDDLVIPTWTGNEFALPDGSRAPIRTFTPCAFDPHTLELTIDVVLHDGGAASDWAAAASPGVETAVSGPGRAEPVDDDASSYLVAGDETAIPAIRQLLTAIADDVKVLVHVEVADEAARQDLPVHPNAEVTWHVTAEHSRPGNAVVTAIEGLDAIPDGVWVAGEAAAVQRVRIHLVEVRGRSRSSSTVRGYWKYGRAAS